LALVYTIQLFQSSHTLYFSTSCYNSFSRETPQRFKKEMVKAAQSNDGTVNVDKLNEILINIGRPDKILSEAEMHQLLHEGGGTEESRSIQAAAMMRLL
jgi:hypothetical protein